MKLFFGSIIVIALLIIYVCLIIFGVEVAQCVADQSCSDYVASDFSEKMANALTLIGGLVSALVIAELAVTEPGQVPLARILNADASTKKKNWVKIIAGVYISVWIIFGLYAYVYGYLKIDTDQVSAIAELGQGWLGIAVGAGYAYFGIKRSDGT